jgi:Uncharacterized protein conserved in bacteria (DUF2252)
MPGLPTIEDATRAYEEWMARYTAVVRTDLALKHDQMRHDVFRFLRATFYRWQQLWPSICEKSAGAPAVLAVADLHIENFGTWRDPEGRLIWGVNDFDEASELPYTNDLTRLATSAFFAIDTSQLHLTYAEAAGTILDGYVEALRAGGRPFVLEGEHRGLRKLALSELRDPAAFWDKLRAGRPVTGKLPRGARKTLEAALPDGVTAYKIRRRVAGVGSLGRPRFVALADCYGAPIAREAKARVPSACVWGGAAGTNAYQQLLTRAIRVPDPCTQVRPQWIVRRLAPDCSRIELASLPRERDERRLLHAMGKETANIHLGSSRPRRILDDVARRPARWLEADARRMTELTMNDWERWRHRG